MFYNVTKHRKIRKTFSKKYFTLKQTEPKLGKKMREI